MKRGVFITFEGCEGCGKSTQSKMLFSYLKKQGYQAIYLREPGGTFLSEKIRRILLDAENQSMTAACEMLLYMASRAQLVEEVIIPALKQGKIVVSDRFLDSTLAYQGYGLKMDIGFIRRLGSLATQGIRPDLTIFLGLAVEKGLNSCGKSKDRIEQRDISYHLRVRRGYLSLARKEPGRIKIVKLGKEKTQTAEKIKKIVLEFLGA